MRVGVDIDDCIYPWFSLAEEVCASAGITNGKRARQWDMHVDYGCTKQQWIKALDDATRSGLMYAAAPIPGSIDALHRIREAGHTIHLQTARGFFVNGYLIRSDTLRWLDKYRVPHDSLSFIKDKSLLQTDIAIDDAPHNAHALIEAGTLCYLMDAPHNQDNEDLVRIYDMHQFADEVIKAGKMLGSYAA